MEVFMYIAQLADALRQAVTEELQGLEAAITKTDTEEHGDYSLPCFFLSKQLHKAPALIAQEFAEKIRLPEAFVKCENVGPYLNFFLNKALFAENVFSQIEAQGARYGSSFRGDGKECFLEHTSINPNASPHIGRARNAIVGDFIARLMRFEGYHVTVHYFVNDIGKQISMLVLGAEDADSVRFEDLLELYVKVNQKVQEDPAVEKAVFDQLYKLENGDEEVRKRFRQIVDICIHGQTGIFNKLGICYDCFDYESVFLFDNSLNQIVEKLKQKDMLFEDESGRYVVNLDSHNLMPLVITRADKTSLYPLRDIAYTIWKAEHNADKNLIVLGQDQELYFSQIAAIVSDLGYRPPEVVHYSFVLLVEGKMSTRQGTVVLLEDFMREAVKKAAAGGQGRENTVSAESAQKIAYSAVKYSMEKTSNERNVVFDWDAALSFEGDTAPYLQYSYVRIQSILSRFDQSIGDAKNTDCSLLTHQTEHSLITELANFPETILQAAKELSPHIVARYAFGLAKSFSVFYHECRILDVENPEIQLARIRLIRNVQQVLANCFTILGIEAIDHM